VQDNRTNRIADLNPNEIEDIQVLKDAAAAALYGSRATNGVVIITTKRGRSGQPRYSLTQRAGQSSLLRGLGTRCFADSSRAVTAGAAGANQAIAIEAFNAAKPANGGNIPANDHVPALRPYAPAWESYLQVTGGTTDATRYSPRRAASTRRQSRQHRAPSATTPASTSTRTSRAALGRLDLEYSSHEAPTRPTNKRN
jgi:TonB-dependent SusC/RagA subfamily outer membrane receptor